MKRLLAFLFAMLFSRPSPAVESTFYLGTYTHADASRGIYVGTLDGETGKLGKVTLAGEAKNPTFLASSHDGKFLYAAIENGAGGVMAFRVREDKGLEPLNQQPLPGGACHVWVDATGRYLLAASYGDGVIACFRIQPDGSLGERTAFVQFTGSGPDRQRQEKPHAHSIYTDAENRFVYVCDLGTNHIWIFRFDPEKGTLSPSEPPKSEVPPGAGPRHLAIHPGSRFAYVANEMGLSVTAFARDPQNGALTPFQTLSTLPAGTAAAGSSTAEIFCHPCGRWLYVSNRGHDSIAVFAIDKAGALRLIQSARAAVKKPRSFGIDPTGKWIITAGESDNRIAVLRIDPDTGLLAATAETASVGRPACVLFAPPLR